MDAANDEDRWQVVADALVAERDALAAEVRRLEETLRASEVVRDLADRVDRIGQLEAEVRRVRELHVAEPCSHCGPTGTCAHCDTAYPCPTVRALEGS